MPDTARNRNIFGFGVALLGLVVVIVPLVLLAAKTIDSNSLIITLVVIGALLVGMGMYIVLPTETAGAFDEVRETLQHLPLSRFKGDGRSKTEPVIVSPAEDQAAIVNPHGADPIVVTSDGEVRPLERADDPPPEVEIIDGDADADPTWNSLATIPTIKKGTRKNPGRVVSGYDYPPGDS